MSAMSRPKQLSSEESGIGGAGIRRRALGLGGECGNKPIAVDTIMATECAFMPGGVCARQGVVCVRRARGLCARALCVCARCVCVRRARMAVHEPVRGARVIAVERVCAREPWWS